MKLLLLASLALAPASASEVEGEVRVLTFRAEAVDGVDELVLEGRRHRIEHMKWRPIRGADVEVHERVPRKGTYRVVVREKTGRVRVTVTQQPRAENDHVVRVLLDDGPHSGAAKLSFELWAVPHREAPNPIDVVLVTIDSLRPDHLSCYGYARRTSPVLDAFAERSVTFTNAHSTSSFTPPSHASMFTSRQVGDHGLLTWNPLPDEQLCLAEILSLNGYRTGASTALDLCSAQNLGQGFEVRSEHAGEARDIVDDALAFLREDDGRPFFLWLHVYDVHRPYGRIPGWSERFGSHDEPSVGSAEHHYNLTPDDVRERGLSPEALRFVVDRYDAGIAYTDAQLGPLLAELSTPERRANTLVIVTADHGESLLDHRERLFTHDPFLFSAVTRIPLLVRFPGERWAGREVGDLVSCIDLAPTVTDLAGLEAPPTFQGRSLAGLVEGRVARRHELFMETWGWERLSAVRTSGLLAILDDEDGETRVFDLSTPSGENAPLERLSSGARRVEKRLETFRSRLGADARPPPLSEDVLRRLRELGYAGD